MNKKSWRKDHLTSREVAKLLRVNPVTVRQWAARGQLPSLTTPGGHRRFLQRDVQEFARSRGIIRSAQERRPDAVVLDLTVPGVDALGVSRRLRPRATLGHIRIVAITRGATPEGIERGLEELGLGRS